MRTCLLRAKQAGAHEVPKFHFAAHSVQRQGGCQMLAQPHPFGRGGGGGGECARAGWGEGKEANKVAGGGGGANNSQVEVVDE
eukprot:1580238-Pyramimonas_sp.AAC.1